MNIKEINHYFNKFKFGVDNYHNLMKNKISEILIVSTFYDAFVFEQDNNIFDQILGEYQHFNLSTTPRITSVPSGVQALEVIKNKKFDIIISMIRIGDISPFELSKKAKEIYQDIPFYLLLSVQSDISILNNNSLCKKYIDDVFYWNGDSKVLLAIIKSVEDKWNLEYDTKFGLVRVILLVEDNIIYYSKFLPLLYSEILKQTQRLIDEEENTANKRLRMRGRPKVILVHDYQDALEILDKYKEYIITVISDVSYPNNGIMDNEAGFHLISHMKAKNYLIPMLLQSSELKNKQKAQELGAAFLLKQSKVLLKNLRKFVIERLGFGDFVFRNQQHDELARARTMLDFEKLLKTVPEETLLYHSRSNAFSTWLIARGEFQVAKQLLPIKVNDFKTVSDLRNFLLSTFEQARKNRIKGSIVDFSPDSLTQEGVVVRMAQGSLGGKGRGLAFLNALLVSMEFDEKYPEVKITIPSTTIIGTEEFDLFLDYNNIDTDRLQSLSDREIKEIFLEGNLSNDLMNNLDIYLDYIKSPIAVRSSGLLEDSQAQPFAGIYETYMLPNNSKEKWIRIKQLADAIKLVFSSVYHENARNYIEGINYQVEEEKMAVVIQEIVGKNHQNYFYPNFSGVAQSFNFYPTSYMKNGDGIVSLAVGLGKYVVEGKNTYMFCPKYPKTDIVTQKEIMGNNQKDFFALDINNPNFNLIEGEDATLIKLNIKTAKEHKALAHLYSVWDFQNNRLVENQFLKGPIVVRFANILKYNYIPLSKIIEEILQIGEIASGVPVEIEFAVNMTTGKHKASFYLLQIRPLTVNSDVINIDTENINKKKLLLFAYNSMGNSLINDIYDVIFIKRDKFDKTKTKLMRSEVAEINNHYGAENKKFIMIGPGRWGTRDPFLGIPVKWNEINNASILIEIGLKNFIIDPSQGTHFFHNLVAKNIGYFNVPFNSEKHWIDWEWLEAQEVTKETEYFKIIHFEKPFTTKIDGHKGLAIISKPNSSDLQ
jgi:hypothetical protein